MKSELASCTRKSKAAFLDRKGQGDLGGRDPRFELEVRALLVLVPDVDAVLEETVQDAADAERRLDDGGCERKGHACTKINETEGCVGGKKRDHIGT
jgi:hypothetical protein